MKCTICLPDSNLKEVKYGQFLRATLGLADGVSRRITMFVLMQSVLVRLTLRDFRKRQRERRS